MTLTVLDPNTALVVIDLQQGIAAMSTIHAFGDIVARATELIAAFRAHELPVVLVNVAGRPPGRTEAGAPSVATFPPGWSDLVPELGAQPSDVLITKYSRGAFTNTGLQQQLTDRGVTQIVLSGISTSGGVESTARDAHERGFNVSLVTDAMTDRESAAHEHSIGQIFPRIGETGTTAEVLALLDQRGT